MLNRIILVGRLTKEPNLRKTNSDMSVCNFTIAVDNTAKEADGTRGTCFLECRAFGDKAENLCKFVAKGSKVAVDGSINQRNFERKDGTKGHDFYVLVDSIEFLDKKPVNEQQEAEQAIVDNDLPDDDLPFNGEEAKPQKKSTPKSKGNPEPKYDPYTGKPLKPKAK